MNKYDWMIIRIYARGRKSTPMVDKRFLTWNFRRFTAWKWKIGFFSSLRRRVAKEPLNRMAQEQSVGDVIVKTWKWSSDDLQATAET